MPYVNKDADQPGHLHSLISTFVVRCLESIISRDVQDSTIGTRDELVWISPGSKPLKTDFLVNSSVRLIYVIWTVLPSVMCPKDADKMANSEDPDQTLITVCPCLLSVYLVPLWQFPLLHRWDISCLYFQEYETGEKHIRAGRLNLVDMAGSEKPPKPRSDNVSI